MGTKHGLAAPTRARRRWTGEPRAGILASTTSYSQGMLVIKIYLAGPDVFLADARRVGERKQQICREFGFEGLFPLDNDDAVGADAAKIFRENCALMRKADAGVFNLTPFRGPSADAGTVFELGFMFALGKPVYGYTSATGNYLKRVSALEPVKLREGEPSDRDGYAVENFGLIDNLMIAHAIEASDGAVAAVAEPTASGASLAAFEAFKACLQIMQSRLAEAEKVRRSRRGG